MKFGRIVGLDPPMHHLHDIVIKNRKLHNFSTEYQIISDKMILSIRRLYVYCL